MGVNLASFTSIDTSISLRSDTSPWSHFRDFWALLKPRVMSLVVFTGFVGMFLAPGELHYVLQTVAIICIAVGAGASGAINMWFDRDIDQIMSRTRGRPIPSGRVNPEAALTFGVVLSGGSVMIMGLAVNWLASFLLAATIAFYIFIYTVWLKRSTPQNIVIGGAAGAFPPVIGWAAISGSVSLDPIILFTLIFVWTPPHFWALALYRSDDYEAAGVPMLPITHGPQQTRRQILIYSSVLFLVSLLPYLVGMAALTYFIVAGVMGALFLVLAWRVYRFGLVKNCKQLFGFSILYLFVLFLALLVDKAIGFPFPLELAKVLH